MLRGRWNAVADCWKNLPASRGGIIQSENSARCRSGALHVALACHPRRSADGCLDAPVWYHLSPACKPPKCSAGRPRAAPRRPRREHSVSPKVLGQYRRAFACLSRPVVAGLYRPGGTNMTPDLAAGSSVAASEVLFGYPESVAWHARREDLRRPAPPDQPRCD